MICIMKQRNKPTILTTQVVASSKIFTIEQVEIQFSNGITCRHERLCPATSIGSVMMVPVLNNQHFMLIREYASGIGDYVLGFPKGGVKAGENYKDAANRELMEEAGYHADKITHIAKLASSPSYSSHYMHIYLGRNLSPRKLVEDEPESIEVVHWRFDEIDKLLNRNDFQGAREISALFLITKYLTSNKSYT